ncbi:unnamed protein product [Mytilus edulis]|uniref:Sushi domain-containing protein n=1 Tax=Mytilus edulis TaxID=6550 RepID=A0A8S3QKP0_MYTED|nr:unnamed protein product [Mytilus edulis]
MDDVCSADDDTCKKPNLSGVGMIEKGKCSLTGVLLRFHQLSMLECAKKCFITSNCTSINYRQNWKLCDLVMSDDDGNEIADDSTCIRSNITTWQKSLAGKCADHKCEGGKTCEFNPNDKSLKCVEAYCKGLPNTPNATVDERFGLRRNLDTGNKYKCNKGYEMKGNPFAVCKSPGEWKVCFTAHQLKSVARINSSLTEKRPLAWSGDLVSITSKSKWDFIMGNFKSVGSIWIGLKDKTWMTGESFNNIFGVTVQLNDYDGDYSSEDENSCGILQPSSSNKLKMKTVIFVKGHAFFVRLICDKSFVANNSYRFYFFMTLPMHVLDFY